MLFAIRKAINKILRVILLVILITMSFNGSIYACCGKNVEIRKVIIKIIDKSTGLPIEGMPVYYTLRTNWPDRFLFVFNNPVGNDIKAYRVMEEYVSDRNGEIMIPSRKIALQKWKSEDLYDENIYVNIDTRLPTPNAEQKHKDLIAVLFSGKKDFINPVSAYRGFTICSMPWDMDPKKYGGNKFEIADALWNGKGLLKKEPETFVIELERWDTQAGTIKGPSGDQAGGAWGTSIRC